MINKILDLLSKIFNKNRKYFKDFFSKVWEIMFKPEMCFLPGHLAFSVILSVVPVLSIITAIASSFGLTVEDLSSFLNRIFSSINFEVIVPNIMGQEISLKYISVIISINNRLFKKQYIGFTLYKYLYIKRYILYTNIP